MSNTSSMPDFKSMPRRDQIFLGGTLLALICTFLPFDGISYLGFSASENAWHGIGFLGALLVFIVFVLAVVNTFAASSIPELPVSLDLIMVGAEALAVLIFLLHWVTLPSYHGIGVHVGLSLRWGGYATIIVVAATAVIGAKKVLSSGETLPWQKSGGATPPPPAV
jgi:hypothetical protein